MPKYYLKIPVIECDLCGETLEGDPGMSIQELARLTRTPNYIDKYGHGWISRRQNLGVGHVLTADPHRITYTQWLCPSCAEKEGLSAF